MKTFGLSDVSDEELRQMGAQSAAGAMEEFDRKVEQQVMAISLALGVEIDGRLQVRLEQILFAEMIKAMTDRMIPPRNDVSRAS